MANTVGAHRIRFFLYLYLIIHFLHFIFLHHFIKFANYISAKMDVAALRCTPRNQLAAATHSSDTGSSSSSPSSPGREELCIARWRLSMYAS
jgi:hypothetical protein